MAIMKRPFTPLFALFAGALVLGACSTSPSPATEPYGQPSISTLLPRSNVWKVENCTVSAQRGGITLSTDGKLSDNALRVRLHSTSPVTGIPLVRNTALPQVVPVVEGSFQSFGFDVPYSPYFVKSLLDSQTYIVVTYRPASHDLRQLQALFPTQDLPYFLDWQQKHCNR